MTPRVLLEVAVGSAEDAAVAEANGADRVELNAALTLGGLTPSAGLMLETRRAVRVPLVAMARPRPGGFCYRQAEFRTLLRDVEFALANGADGIAFGSLSADGGIDRSRCTEVVRLIGSRVAVFHRAFDVTPDPGTALEELIDLGVRRVMTSGQEETARQGVATIARLVEQARGRIEVLPAAGINPRTVAEVVARTGCDQVHASLRTTREDRSAAARPQVRFGGSAEDRYEVTDAAAVREVRWRLDGVGR
ncbi:MAG: copper homeostasis protein CutC [Gemmataceae bacterium]